MPDPVAYLYDAAPAISQGRRDHQEDSLAVDFSRGAGYGFIVLADGMGGHAAGDIASKIVVTEIFSELKMHAGDPAMLEDNIGNILRAATECANDSVASYARRRPGVQGMGSTLVAPVVINNRLYWISVGDSPLYLFRGNRLFRLNEEHSLARRMDRMVRKGEMDPGEAEQHPDRQCLTSVLIGDPIPEVDCRDVPVELRDHDIVIAASDGLQFLTEPQIAQLIYEHRHHNGEEISNELLKEIDDLDDPEQDNVAICVLKVKTPRAEQKTAAPGRRLFLNLHGEKKLMMSARPAGGR